MDVDPGSYRDPGSRVFRRNSDVFRALDARAMADWEQLQTTRFFSAGVADGTIVSTERVDVAPPPGEWAGVLRHDAIPIISYPYEWTFSMLRDAALLQLDLMSAALAENMILKDATPYNVQWRGPRPVFIDIGSFERLEPGDLWVGYRQFLQQYLYPLMLTARVGVPFQPLLRGQPEGISADELSRMLSPKDRLRKSSLLHVILPARAERRYGMEGGDVDVRSELQQAGFTTNMIATNVTGLRRIVESLSWDPGSSTWNRYAADCDHVELQRDAKADFVTGSLLEHAPDVVWDLGTNDGYFAKLAAVTTDQVLALDADHLVLDELYQSLRNAGVPNVLPLIQDLANPSPGIGWRGSERPPLLDRSSPDLVLCLAVVHHLVIGRNVPLPAVVDWLAGLDAHVVLEFVPPDDPMVRQLTANKRSHEIHRDYTEDALREYLARSFRIEREQAVPAGNRRLFALTPLR